MHTVRTFYNLYICRLSNSLQWRKFSNQKNNKNQLEIKIKDAEKRLAAAKKAYNRQEMLFQVAYCCSGRFVSRLLYGSFGYIVVIVVVVGF